jgi:hypothetical protein
MQNRSINSTVSYDPATASTCARGPGFVVGSKEYSKVQTWHSTNRIGYVLQNQRRGALPYKTPILRSDCRCDAGQSFSAQLPTTSIAAYMAAVYASSRIPRVPAGGHPQPGQHQAIAWLLTSNKRQDYPRQKTTGLRPLLLTSCQVEEDMTDRVAPGHLLLGSGDQGIIQSSD